jgi:hypothetical protein
MAGIGQQIGVAYSTPFGQVGCDGRIWIAMRYALE